MAEVAEASPRQAAATYTVTAVRYGSLRASRSRLFHRYESYGEPDGDAEMAYYFWLLHGEGDAILVDTGFDPSVGRRRGRTCLVEPIGALERLGIAPADVSTVVVTHFHYDHVGNLDAFPDAELVVPRRELAFWTGPMARRDQFAEHVEAREIEHLERAVAAGRVRTTDGDEEVLPGIRAIAVGGHSPGQQVTVVETRSQPVVLASDAVHFYEELERDRPFGVIVDLERMYRAYDLLRGLAEDRGAVIVPGHDPEVMERFPSIDGGFAVTVQGRGPIPEETQR